MIMLLNPVVRNILIVLALSAAALIGYAIWSDHLEQLGAQVEKDKEAAIALQHEQEVQSKATAVDQAVSQDQTPQDTLNKQWSQP